ncbi:MAG TPA: secretin [Firmicutes bacterium]|nr:secretin [Bacillota bacterium]
MKRQFQVIISVVIFLILTGILEASDEQPLVNLLLFETDIREALSEITMQTGVNIIADGTVGGPITADLQDVPLEKALRMILISGGYTYRKIDDFYFVGLPDPRSTTFGELVVSEVVHLTHVTANKVLNALPSFLSAYVKGEYDSKFLIITAPEPEIGRIRELIEQIDQPAKQVEVQVIVTEVSTSFLKDMGANLFSYAFGAGQTLNENWQSDLEYKNSSLLFGIDLYGQLLSQLKLAEQEGNAKIHANPKVVVADGKTAELFIGDRQILLLPGSTETSTRTERIDVGVRLKVVPQTYGDKIMLTISPEISHFMNEAKPDLIIKNSTVSTTVLLENGQTAMLAGMTLQTSADYSDKVPVLGDIPIIRWFFRNDVTREAESELLVFVTPAIR